MGTFKQQQKNYHMMKHTIIDISTKYGVVPVCPPFPTQKYSWKLPKIYGNLEMSSIRATLGCSVAIVMHKFEIIIMFS